MDAVHGADHDGWPAGLKEPFEVAIDGANAIQAFFRLILPMLSASSRWRY
jgi:hypothetical protein